jgi:hypothetical protein
MKFLLFFISLFFSFVYYVFYSLSEWKTILWKKLEVDLEKTQTWETISNYNIVSIDSISWNLLIESFIFIIIWVIFLYIFSDIKYNKSNKPSKLWAYKLEIIYFLFYLIGTFYLLFIWEKINIFLISILSIFIFSDIIFNHISTIKRLATKKIIFRYIWLLLNYISSILIIFYTINKWIYFIPLFILLYNFIFNIFVHKKYNNIISLIISILLLLFFIYVLFFSKLEVYIGL